MDKATISVLVIDDETVIRESTANYLEDYSFRVFKADNGRVGLEIFEQESPDIVLTDLRMPEVDGLEVLKRIREISPETPIIVISGTGRIGDSVQALRLGAWDYILKPVEDLSIISISIDKALERVRLLRENKAYQENLEVLVQKRTIELNEANINLTNVNTRLQKVLETTRGLTLCSDIISFGSTLLDEFAEHMVACGGSLFLVENDGLRLLHSLEPNHVPRFIPFPLPDGSILNRTIKESKPLLISDITKEENLDPSGWEGYSDGSILTFPLTDETGNIVGVLTLHSKSQPPFVEQDKEIGAILASYSSETLRAVNATATLRVSEARFRDLAEMLPEAIFETDKDLDLTYANRRAFELFGYSMKDFKEGLNAFDILVSEERDLAKANFTKRLRKVRLESIEYQAIRKDNSIFPILLHINPIMDGDDITGFRGIAIDITLRKQAENEITAEKNRANNIIEGTNAGTWDWNIQTGEVVLNERWAEIMGCTLQELEPINIQTMINNIHPDDLANAQLEEHVTKKRNYYDVVFRQPHKSGKWVWVNARGKVVEWTEDGKPLRMSGTHLDITESKNAEDALRENEAKYRHLIEDSSDAIYLLYNRRFEIINKKFTQLFGITIEQANSPEFDFINLVVPEDRPIVEERILLQSHGETLDPKYEFRAFNHQGQVILLEAVVSHIKYKKGFAAQGIIRDISEKRKLEEQLQQAQKMEAIGTLAGGVAHDFNNLLTVINGYSEMALLGIDYNNKLYRNLEAISQAGKRAVNLTSQLLAFSRKQIYNAEILDINSVIQEMDRMLRRLIGEDINIEMALGEIISKIKADKSQLEQILINLIVNARDAVLAITKPEYIREICIKTGSIDLDKDYVSSHPGSKEGPHIFFSVSDNGIGMDEETKSKIFEPFFTTKDKFKGTGLGLSTVYGIIKQNNSSIYVDSKPGEGTTFNIYWSVSDQKDALKAKAILKSQNFSGDESVLLVEDDAEVCRFAHEALTSFGYNVCEASNGRKAFEIIKKDKDKFDLIVTDLIMPELNGEEFIKKVEKIISNVKVIYVSGYTDDHIVHDGMLKKGVNFIHKPYSAKTLGTKVRWVLDNE